MIDATRLVEDAIASVPVRPTPGDLIVTTASAIRPEEVHWAWDQRILLGGLTVVAGNPGLGKSSLATELLARLTRGQLAGDLYGNPADVLIATAEDHLAAVVIPRLTAGGADLDRVHVIEGVAAKDGMDTLSVPDHVERIGAAIRRTGAKKLVVDPLSSHLSDRVDSHGDHPMRRALGPLASMAEDLGIAVVVIVHLTKSGASDPLMRVMGSIATVAAARSVLLVAPDPEDERGRIVAVAKSNVAEIAPALRFGIQSREIDGWDGERLATSGIVWRGEAEGILARDLLDVADPEDRSDRADAAEWLRAVLSEGALPADQIARAAKADGIEGRMLRRAKEAIGVRSRKEGFGGGWVWSLPDRKAPDEGATLGAEGRLGRLRTLAAETPQVSPEEAQGATPGPNRRLRDDPTSSSPVSLSDYIADAVRDGDDPDYIAAQVAETLPPPDGYESWTPEAMRWVVAEAAKARVMQEFPRTIVEREGEA